jgi:hypothetical protein
MAPAHQARVPSHRRHWWPVSVGMGPSRWRCRGDAHASQSGFERVFQHHQTRWFGVQAWPATYTPTFQMRLPGPPDRVPVPRASGRRGRLAGGYLASATSVDLHCCAGGRTPGGLVASSRPSSPQPLPRSLGLRLLRRQSSPCVAVSSWSGSLASSGIHIVGVHNQVHAPDQNRRWNSEKQCSD